MGNKRKYSGLTDEERLKAVAEMPDEEIDFSDAPEVTNFDGWQKFSEVEKEIFDIINRPDSNKVTVNLRLDREIVDFFKSHSKKYQSKINETLLALVRQYKKIHEA